MTPHARHHQALLHLLLGHYGTEDFATYPDVVYPTLPFGPVRWDSVDDKAQGDVTAGVCTVNARHNNTGGLRYNARARTGGKYVRVLLDWYPGIADEERRVLVEVNSVPGLAFTPILFYYAAESAQVALAEFTVDSRCSTVYELTARPNAQLAISNTEPTWLELFVPTDPNEYLEARTWGLSQPRPSVPGYSAQVAALNSQYNKVISSNGQCVLRSIQEDTARVRQLAILSTP